MWIVSYVLYKCLFIFIEHAFLALLSERTDFYIKKSKQEVMRNTINVGGVMLYDDNKNIDTIAKKFKLNGLYYGKDKHSLFKRSKLNLLLNVNCV